MTDKNAVTKPKELEYSQNFLRSHREVRRAVKNANIKHDELVIEIGPGKGAITKILQENFKNIIAVEKDVEYFNKLPDLIHQQPTVQILNRDFLEYDLPKSRPYSIVSNIPFNLTADIVRKLFYTPNPPQTSILIVQKDAAEKFIGTPKDTESLTSLTYKAKFAFEIVHTFNPRDFSPIPAVTPVILKISYKPNKVLEDNIVAYRDFITYCFTNWSPTIKQALKDIFTHNQVSRLSKDLKFTPESKPTQLSFDQWKGLFEYFLIGVEDSKKRIIKSAHVKQRQKHNKHEKWRRARKGRHTEHKRGSSTR